MFPFIRPPMLTAVRFPFLAVMLPVCVPAPAAVMVPVMELPEIAAPRMPLIVIEFPIDPSASRRFNKSPPT